MSSQFARKTPLKWFQRRVRGSVLILVVGLVVLLALLGTAFIATARIDRYQAVSFSSQTLVDPEADEVTQEITSVLYNDLLNAGKYRPAWTQGTYAHLDSSRPDAKNTNKPWDIWLGDRVPVVGPNNLIIWRVLSRMPGKTFVNIQTAPVAGQFVPVSVATNGYDPYDSTNGVAAVPTSIAVVAAARTPNASPPDTPRVYPGVQLVNANNGTVIGAPFIAADASGSGVADSLLFDTKVTSPSSAGTLNYFAAVRIVDNNSAVNINTAWSRTTDYQTGFAPSTTSVPTCDALGAASASAGNLGWFPSHVGLLEMLDPRVANTPPSPANGAQQGEMAFFNAYRFNTNFAITSTPYEGGNSQAANFTFLTLGDALWMQLGRRTGNPATVLGSKAPLYQTVEDGGKMGWHFNMLDPNANVSPGQTTVLPPTKVEEKLFNSEFYDAINYVQHYTTNHWTLYPADKALYWFDYNFNYDHNITLDKSHDNKDGTVGYTFLDTDPLVGGYFYHNLRALTVAHNALSNATPMHSDNPAALRVVPVPYPAAPPSGFIASYMKAYPGAPTNAPRTSINTAAFDELWRAFWNVMADDTSPSTVPAVPNIYAPTQANPGATWSPKDQLLIRAALAAVNAEALRNTSATRNIISHHLILPDGYQVEVYGNDRQPFIVGYNKVAGPNQKVTLYNPYSAILTVNGLQMVFVNSSTHIATKVGGMVNLTINPGTTNDLTFIVANDPNVWASNNFLPGMLILTRPRSSAGTLNSPAATIVDPFDESKAEDMVPLDQVDAQVSSSRTQDWTCVQDNGASKVIQLHNDADMFPGPSAQAQKFPFGVFARIGDILRVPFMGSYKVYQNASYWLVPISRDAVACNNNSPSDVGRFCPLSVDPAGGGSSDYDFAKKIFDYFTTIENPNDDYAPNIIGGLAIANTKGSTANQGAEDNVGVEGLININTAPVQVLAALPMCKLTSDNLNLAKAIVLYRDGDGTVTHTPHPFHSIFELNLVTDIAGGSTNTFQNGWGSLKGKNDLTIGPPDGEFSTSSAPMVPAGTQDYKWKFLMVSKISNLITTRSDSFTCYVVVQAWLNAGTPNATMVAQKRVSFTASRVGCGDGNSTVQTQGMDR